MSFFRGHEVETDEGLAYVYPGESLLRMASQIPGAGQDCPVCGQHCALFYGDPDGEHWCAFCQIKRELDAMPAPEPQ